MTSDGEIINGSNGHTYARNQKSIYVGERHGIGGKPTSLGRELAENSRGRSFYVRNFCEKKKLKLGVDTLCDYHIVPYFLLSVATTALDQKSSGTKEEQ